MRRKIRSWVLLAALVAVGCVLPVSNASATTITFAGLAGANGDPFLGPYTEAGFRVSVVGGNWFQAQVFGNPTPSLYEGPIGAPTVGTLAVQSLTPFTFNAFDFASNNGRTAYDIRGLGLDGIWVNFQSGVATNSCVVPGCAFSTIASLSSTLFQGIELRFTPQSNATNPLPTSYNIDNIVVTAASVPEPATLALLGTGFAVVFAGSRKRRMRA